MQIILLEKVAQLGSLGDVVKVKDGFARNFLLPTGRARRATPSAMADVHARREQLEKEQADKLQTAQALAKILDGRTVQVSHKAGVDGRLFGSVSAADVAQALSRAGLAVAKQQLRLPFGPLKTVGTHEVQAVLHGEVTVDLAVQVSAAT